MDKERMDIKQQIMKLWKETFHDSDSYINLIFDNYYDPEFVEYKEEHGEIVSAMLAIPYKFGNGTHSVSGIYLCGLATKDNYRGKGIMTELISKINNKVKEKGYSFTFLIPASDMLRLYYQNKGYVNAIYRVEERYTNIHNFYNDCLTLIDKEDVKLQEYRRKYLDEISVYRLENNRTDELKNIRDYIQKKESEPKQYLCTQHTEKDIAAIISENAISGGEIYFAKAKNNEVKGIAFVTFDDRKRIIINKTFYDDPYSYYKMLDNVKKAHYDSAISIWRYPDEINRQAIWNKVYGAANPNGLAGGAYGVAERVFDVSAHSLPYGMVKLLNLDEILKFIAKDRKDTKFSILVKNENSSSPGVLYTVEGEKVERKPITSEEIDFYNTSRDVTVLTQQDLMEILFRKKDSTNVIMEAFGIPRISLNMSLMLD